MLASYPTVAQLIAAVKQTINMARVRPAILNRLT